MIMDFLQHPEKYDEHLRVHEVSQILDMCNATVYKLIREKKIGTVMLRRKYYVSRDSLVSFLYSQCNLTPEQMFPQSSVAEGKL